MGNRSSCVQTEWGDRNKMVKICDFECKNDGKMFTKLSAGLRDFIEDAAMHNGTITVYSTHTTACVKILEDELLSLMDLKQHLESVASDKTAYLHDNIDLRQVPVNERINGVAHVRSLYFNHAETIPVWDGKLMLGKWQEVFLVELDLYRDRDLIVVMNGTFLV